MSLVISITHAVHHPVLTIADDPTPNILSSCFLSFSRLREPVSLNFDLLFLFSSSVVYLARYILVFFIMRCWFLLVQLFVSLCTAQNGGEFFNPVGPGPVNDYTKNPTYTIGDTVQVRWSTTWDRISLVLWQNGYNEFEYLLGRVH